MHVRGVASRLPRRPFLLRRLRHYWIRPPRHRSHAENFRFAAVFTYAVNEAFNMCRDGSTRAGRRRSL